MRKSKSFAFLFLFALLFANTTNTMAQKKKMNLNKEMSKMEWLGKKVTGEHSGTIMFKEAYIVLAGEKIKDGGVLIDMNTIVCTDIKNEEYRKKLEGHLKSDDFFGVDKFSEAKFELQNSKKLKEGEYELNGYAHIKGIAQPITFTASMKQMDSKVHLMGKLVIDRTKFNVRYGSGSFFDNLGDKTIYDDFELKFDMVFE